MEFMNKIFEAIAVIGIVSALSLFAGCTSLGKSVGLGGAAGAGLGAAIGGIADPGQNGKYRTRNVIIGATAGGVVGAITGATIHESTEREKELAYLKGQNSKSTQMKAGSTPELEEPKVEAQWVESKVMGNRYIEGHFEYIITEPTRWEKPQ